MAKQTILFFNQQTVIFFQTYLGKIAASNNFGGLVQFGACHGGTKSFFAGPTYAFYSYFNGNEEYERRLYSNFYDSYFGSGYNLRARHYAVCKSCDAYVNQRRFG